LLVVLAGLLLTTPAIKKPSERCEYRDDGKFYHVKRLIAGLNQFNRPEIFQAVQDLKTKQVPFVNFRNGRASTSTRSAKR
jgi:hypothetical protein